jgi:undecaprenyl-diphosphatase
MYYDILLFNIINGFAGHSHVLDNFGIFCAEWLAYVIVGALLLFLFIPEKNVAKNRIMVAVALASATFSSFVIKPVILLWYQRPRPYVALPSVHELVEMAKYDDFQSFPSAHALFFFALSAAVFAYNKKLGVVFFTLSIIMGIARVFIGVHWPSDILAGAVIGIAIGYIFKQIATGIVASWLNLKSKKV